METDADSQARLLVFRIDGAEYGLPVEDVAEIVPMVALTMVPDAPTWLMGALNLRGRVVPVVDLRASFGLPPGQPDLHTPIVILEVAEGPVGLLVDSVDEVLSLPHGSLSPPGELSPPSGPVAAVATTGDRLILVLEAGPLVAGSEPYAGRQA